MPEAFRQVADRQERGNPRPGGGTGTFITELIEYFRGRPKELRYKYLEELHANEVAILPYYVANLNIEATYAAIVGYEEYPNLCFVDTLDNMAALKAQKGQHVGDLFGGVSDENVERVKRQNARRSALSSAIRRTTLISITRTTTTRIANIRKSIGEYGKPISKHRRRERRSCTTCMLASFAGHQIVSTIMES